MVNDMNNEPTVKFSRERMDVMRYPDTPSEFVINRKGWMALAVVYGDNGGDQAIQREGLANAHLMAAANRLYAALELILEDDQALEFRPRTAAVVHQAMAEARGEVVLSGAKDSAPRSPTRYGALKNERDALAAKVQALTDAGQQLREAATNCTCGDTGVEVKAWDKVVSATRMKDFSNQAEGF